MANDIMQFQAGRLAAINGDRRDDRRARDWLEGFDRIATEGAARPVEHEFRKEKLDILVRFSDNSVRRVVECMVRAERLPSDGADWSTAVWWAWVKHPDAFTGETSC